MKCELFDIKNGEIYEICTGLMIARIGNDILLIESGTFKKSLGNIFKKERNGEQLESLVDVASKENLIYEQKREINSLQKETSQLKDEHEKQQASLEGKCSVLTKRLEDCTSGIADLEGVKYRYKAHISKLEDDHIKAIDERNECRNKLDKRSEILQQTKKENEKLTGQYELYIKATEEKKAFLRKQRDEYINLVDEMIKDKKNLEKSERLKSKKIEPSSYLLELEKTKGSLESIVEKIFLESPDMTDKQAITLLKRVKSSVNNKKRWHVSTINNRVDTYLKKQNEIKQRIKKPQYDINHKTNRRGESILHNQHTQNIYNNYHVYLTKTGIIALAYVLNERCSEVLTAKDMHDLIHSTLSKNGIKAGKHTYRGYLLYFVLSNRLISSGKGNSFQYTIKPHSSFNKKIDIVPESESVVEPEIVKKDEAGIIKKPELVIEKTCPICGEIKNIDEFYKNKSNKDGHRYSCKTCDRLKKKEQKEKNTERTHPKQANILKADKGKIVTNKFTELHNNTYHRKEAFYNKPLVDLDNRLIDFENQPTRKNVLQTAFRDVLNKHYKNIYAETNRAFYQYWRYFLISKRVETLVINRIVYYKVIPNSVKIKQTKERKGIFDVFNFKRD